MQPARLRAVCLCIVGSVLAGTLALAPVCLAQTVVGTPQQANDRIKELSASVRPQPHDYVIGSGDVLEIEVFDVKELSREVRVSQTGSIGIPLVPVRLQVAGLTETQTEQKIGEVLEANGLVSHPEVSVNVKERRSKPITVVGAVGHPMVYQADGPVTLLEVLAQAGGIAQDAGDTVIITRPVQSPLAAESELAAAESAGAEPPEIGPVATPAKPEPSPDKPDSSPAPALDSASAAPGAAPASPAGPTHPMNAITVNLNELVEKGDATNNIPLQAGDIVTVPHAGIVYVLGAVPKPGGFVLANDRGQMSTLKILALAGGLNRTAKSDRAVIIRKDNQGKAHEVAVDLKKVQNRQTEDVLLQPSDILYVPDSGVKQALVRAAEFGVVLGSAVVLYRLAYH
ncbi:MAG TPA: polysaccharide biosynthesis/export family protein [Candidatus Dormibacteraeota bacterium]|nr:polysaccharide biosynthesis/export family protein [Candidatus Dormibacteraeota bacterium]